MTSKAREDGERLLGDMLGEGYIDQLREDVAAGVFGAFFADHSVEACFGTIWARPGLDLRSRSLVTLGMVIGLRDEPTVKNHIRAGLKNGLTPEEIEEVIYQAIPYLGYPTTGIAVRAAREVFAEDEEA